MEDDEELSAHRRIVKRTLSIVLVNDLLNVGLLDSENPMNHLVTFQTWYYTYKIPK